MFDVIVMSLTFVGAIVIVGSVSFWLLIPTSILIIILYYMRVVYITTSRAVKRLEGISKFHFITLSIAFRVDTFVVVDIR